MVDFHHEALARDTIKSHIMKLGSISTEEFGS